MDEPKFFLLPSALNTGDFPIIGGKGVNLAELMRGGINVPSWYGITTHLFKHIMKKEGFSEKISNALSKLSSNDNIEKIDKIASGIREKIENITLTKEISDELKKWHKTIIPEEKFFSVRSSAVDEDSVGASFAGLHDSFLFVRRHGDLVAKIKKVWASAYNTRAIVFRLKHGIPVGDIFIGVIVQEMVEADVSGIMFTANPNTGNVQEILVSSLFGSGEGIVSAGLDADLYTISKRDGSMEKEIVQKKEKMVFDPENKTGLIKTNVASRFTDTDSLSGSQVKTISNLGRQIETYFEKPQDIEFSIDKNGEVFILQARPITTLDEYGPCAGNRLIWDNSNIIESYSGPTSPMTFSFIRRAYTIVYHCFSEVMGISKKKVTDNQQVFENMLGLFNGQVYYNIINWYRLIHLFPGFNYNKSFMESMMGLKEKIDLTGETPEKGFFNRYFVELPGLVSLLVRSIMNFARIKSLVRKFNTHFDTHYQIWSGMNFDRIAPHRLMRVYRDMEKKLLWNWKTPIINDFYVMIFYGLLKKTCNKWCGDESGSLQNDLICGEGGIESTEPAKLLMEITRTVKRNPEYRDFFLGKTPEELSSIVSEDKNYHEIYQSVLIYLEKYGFRCMHELKLEEPSLHENPEFIYMMIQNYLSLDDESAVDPDVMDSKEVKIRRHAESDAFKKISNGSFSYIKKKLFIWMLNCARRGVKNRENMRFARTKIYGVLRQLLLAIGRRFADENILHNTHDIFMLTIDEVWDFIKGTAVTTDLKGLVVLRRKEYDSYNGDDASVISDHFETYGMAYHKNEFKDHNSEPDDVSEGGLKGVGCSPGIVTEKVSVLKSPGEDMSLNGEILAAARTDPGWVPLYPAVSGILIERGSILSHSAIVAREMGIPTIVGIPGLLQTLSDGQVVTMDGSSGTVEIVE